MATTQPSADNLLGNLMLNAAKEAQKPLEDDVRALKGDVITLKNLKKETDVQNIQLQEKLGQEAETHNSEVEGLKENLRVLKEETETQKEQLAKLQENCKGEVGNYNSEVESLKESLRVLKEETEAHLREELAKVTSINQDMKQKIRDMSEAYARLSSRLDDVNECTKGIGGMKEDIEAEVDKKIEAEVKEKVEIEVKEELDEEIANSPHPVASTEPLNQSGPKKRRRVCFCF